MVAKSNNQQLLEKFSRTTEEIFSIDELKRKLESGKQLKIKYGVDVTAPTLHIGHAVNLWMLREMQDMGHKVQFLVGDFTTQIGDPTGKNKLRPMIDKLEIEKNIQAFIDSVKTVLRFDDPNLLEIRRNSEWFDQMSLAEFLKLLSMVTHSRLISRDMFKKRIQESSDIYMHEMLYPILQGYDSFMLESDLTIVGSDQLFNEMLGRFYQERLGQSPQVVLTTKVTPGIDGKEKQSKSIGNYIGLAHTPQDKFGRIMSIPDNLIISYLEVYTTVSLDEINDLKEKVKQDPMACKKFLAEKIVERYHGTEVAVQERKWFEETFSSKKTPDNLTIIKISTIETLFDAVLSYFGNKKTNSEIKRLFSQNAISQNGNKVSDFKVLVASGDIIKIGKRDWFKIE
ncbi:MAG: tyrosine--tRNA ligase [Candidatus Cloacimonetes bacterium]|nr:tyrosine--tRNA ligase [Candidatus Cloacimonadota bacterium]